MSKRIASSLVRTGLTPNTISVLGMLAGIAGGFAFAYTHSSLYWFLAGAILVQLRLLANMFDGMVAIESGQCSSVGELYNELPDRVSDAAICIGLGYAVGGHEILGYLAALAAMSTAYVRAMLVSAGAPNDFCGPMAKPQRMFLITLFAAYCLLAPAEYQPVHEVLGGPPGLCLLIIAIGSLATSIRRVCRGARALRSS